MTFLVGQQGTGWTQVSSSDLGSSGNALYFASGYTAVATGTMSRAHIQVGSGSASTSFYKVCVYSGGSLVAASSSITYAVGDASAVINGSITSGQTYILVAVPDTGFPFTTINSGSSNFADNFNTAAHFSFSSPPASLPASDGNTGHEFIVWIDGSLPSVDPGAYWSMPTNLSPSLAQPYTRGTLSLTPFGQQTVNTVTPLGPIVCGGAFDKFMTPSPIP